VSQEEETLWMIKGLIGALPIERLQKVTESYTKIKTIMSEYGDDSVIALALLGAELAAKA
jgi:hypothetical protein